MVEIRYPYPNWKYIQPLVQEWYDDSVHRGVMWGRRMVTAVIGEQEQMDATSFNSMTRVSMPGRTTFYAVDENDRKHEIPADVIQHIFDLASLKAAADAIKTIACMWCGGEFQPESIEEHEVACVA